MKNSVKLTLTCIALNTMLCYSTAEVVLLNGGKADLKVMRDEVNVLGVGSMNRELDKYLNVTPIRTEKVSNAKACQVHCIAEKNCSSINVAKPASSAGIVQCELLSTDKFASVGKLGSKSDSTHYYWFERGRWVLIARFSNADRAQWSQTSGAWWYDLTSPVGDASSTSVNADMINSHFWEIPGTEIKLTRSDDTSNTALLQTTSNCLAGQTFREKMTSFGDYRNGERWPFNSCRGTCDVVYGGKYLSTTGFEMAHCNGSLQAHNKIGFFCHWENDASAFMIGGGGSECGRADHGIMVTERNAGGFNDLLTDTYDFGFDSEPSTLYALNLWIRMV